MTGEQVQAPSSPRDGEDVAITIGRPKVVYSVLCDILLNVQIFSLINGE
jgi:hypothetical protein